MNRWHPRRHLADVQLSPVAFKPYLSTSACATFERSRSRGLSHRSHLCPSTGGAAGLWPAVPPPGAWLKALPPLQVNPHPPPSPSPRALGKSKALRSADLRCLYHRPHGTASGEGIASPGASPDQSHNELPAVPALGPFSRIAPGHSTPSQIKRRSALARLGICEARGGASK